MKETPTVSEECVPLSEEEKENNAISRMLIDSAEALINPIWQESFLTDRNSRLEYQSAKLLLERGAKSHWVKYPSWEGRTRGSLLEWAASIPEHVNIYAGDEGLCADEWKTVPATEEELAEAKRIVDEYVEPEHQYTISFRRPIPFTLKDK